MRDDQRADGAAAERFGAACDAGFWLGCIPAAAVVIDARFAIIAANRNFERFCEPAVPNVFGLKIGEAVSCTHCVSSGACGTTPHCAFCGAFAAASRSLTHGERAQGICRLLRRTAEGQESFELDVMATHLETDGGRFAVVAFRDVSAEARVAFLERAFVHDLRNCLAGALGYAELLINELGDGTPGSADAQHLAAAIENAAEAIDAHRQLLDAEKGRLVVSSRTVRADAVLEAVRRTYACHAAAASRRIDLGRPCGATLETDPRILGRVLGNLLLNALEASALGETVTMTASDLGDRLAFEVHNPAFIPEEVQLQIFDRTFTTKGEPGRGIGTHTVKLLVERYLGGRVAFTSRKVAGTAFVVSLPKAFRLT
jgi:signal transduction histidine kinase